MAGSNLKLINSIRIGENEEKTTFGNVNPKGFEKLFPFPNNVPNKIADLYGRKLRELGFLLPGYDHLFVVLTPSLPNNKVEVSDIRSPEWQQYVDVGLTRNTWPKWIWENDLRFEIIIDRISAALQAVTNHEQDGLIMKVASMLKIEKLNLEVAVIVKETKKYSIKLSCMFCDKEKKRWSYDLDHVAA